MADYWKYNAWRIAISYSYTSVTNTENRNLKDALRDIIPISGRGDLPKWRWGCGS